MTLDRYGIWLCALLACFLCECGSKEQSGETADKNTAQEDIVQEREDVSANMRSFAGEAKSFHCVAVSADARLLAAGAGTNELRDSPGSGSGQIWLWDLRTGAVKSILRGHKEIVTSVAFSPDSRLLLSAAQDATVRLWSLKTAKELRSIGEHTHPVLAVSFMPDGKRVLVASGDPLPVGGSAPADPIQVNLYDLETGRLLKEFGRHRLPVKNIAITADGRVLATATGWAHIWDVETGTRKATFKQPGVIESVALSPDGKLLLTGNYYGIVTLRNLEAGTCEHVAMHTSKETGEHFEEVSAVAISADGMWGASGGWSKRVCVWQLSADTFHYWDLEHWVSDIAFSPVSNHVYASCWSGRVVELIPPDKKDGGKTSEQPPERDK